MIEPSSDDEISEKIMELVKSENPETVEKLIELTNFTLGINKDISLEKIIELENQGKLKFSQPPGSISKEFNAYLFSYHAAWFWFTTAMSITATISIFAIPENATPYIYIRYILGSLFVLFLPGYSLIKTLFPTKELDNIERIALSIGMSLALVPLVGLLLNYTPFGIKITPITLSLLSITTLLTITGVLREHKKFAERAQANY